jgi:hypothetical protein
VYKLKDDILKMKRMSRKIKVLHNNFKEEVNNMKEFKFFFTHINFNGHQLEHTLIHTKYNYLVVVKFTGVIDKNAIIDVKLYKMRGTADDELLKKITLKSEQRADLIKIIRSYGKELEIKELFKA